MFTQPINITFLFSLIAAPLFAQPTLVKDIQPGIGSGILLGAARSAVVGNTLYFTADDDVHGVELWKSDGSAAGTALVRDIYPGKPFDGPDQFYAVFNGQLYFAARDTAHGLELWRSDDGPEGAVLVRDACPGTCSGVSFSAPGPMAAYQGKLYLRWDDYDTGGEFWATDGTAAGSNLVKDIYPGSAANSSQPYAFTVFQDKLYFAADSAQIGSELWQSDGTAAGTHLVKNINTSIFGDCEMDAPVVGPDAFYFWARQNSGDGRELWKSDGTEAGTVQVKDIRPGSESGQPAYVPLQNSVWLDGRLLFVANDGVAGAELWTTDGTEAGTALLADINPGAGGSNIRFLTVLNGRALFQADDGTRGNELWVTDGSAAGTQLLLDINPGVPGGLPAGYLAPFTVFEGNKLFFTADNGATGREIWITDGTAGGTKLFQDVVAGTAESNPSDYHVIGNTLLFFAQNNPKGRELWKYDLTSVATQEPKPTARIQVLPGISASGLFSVQVDGDAQGPYQLEVFDALGRPKARQVLHSTSQALDLSGLPNGTYLIRVSTEKGARPGVCRVLIAR